MNRPSRKPNRAAQRAPESPGDARQDYARGSDDPDNSTRWCLFLFYAASAGLTSLMLVGAGVVMPLTVMSLAGVCWFVFGMLAFLCFFSRSVVAWIWPILVGFLAIPVGVRTFRDPAAATPLALTFLVIVIGTTGLAAGILSTLRSLGWQRLLNVLALGILNVAFGLLLLQVSAPTLLMTSEVFGALLFLQGAALIVWAAAILPGSSPGAARTDS